MFRKRRRPTPGFGIPPPFAPITGQRATLRVDGIHPYCAMMQVAAEDDYEDYVICRGFDTRIRKFIDYEYANADKPGISVAKPYGKRKIGTYRIGQVYPALLPIQGGEQHTPPSPTEVDWRVGQNPGVTDNPDQGGHPQSLTDVIEALVDHAGKYVNWLLLDASNDLQLVELCAQEDASRNAAYDCLLGTWGEDSDGWCYDDAITVKAIDHRMGAPFAEVGWKGLYQAMPSTEHGTIYVCVSLDCEQPPEGCNECGGA